MDDRTLQLFPSTTARWGLTILAAFAAAGAAAPWMAGSPTAVTAAALLSPRWSHPFGTDDLGRDVFAGVVHGALHSLQVGFVAAGISVVLGLTIGGFAGVRGGVADRILSRVTEFVQALPRFFLVIVVVSLFGSSTWLIVAVLGLTAWPATARTFRAQVMTVREREFVLASRAAGGGDVFVLVRHVAPLAIATIGAQVSYQSGGAILAEAGLSFLGLGDPTVVSWGTLLGSAQAYVRAAWWMSVFPGAAITLTVLACNLVADALVRAPARTVRA